MTILSPATLKARRENLPAVLASKANMNPARPRAARCVALQDQLIKVAVFLDPLGKLVVAHRWAFDIRRLSFTVLAAVRSAYNIVKRLRAKPRIDDDRAEIVSHRLKNMLAQVSQVKDGVRVGYVVYALTNGCL